MQVLALANQKGGCGKTTLAINLAGALSKRGDRVLLIDLDPQAHASLGLGQADFGGLSIASVLRDDVALRRVIRVLPHGFQLVPGSLEAAEYEELAERRLQPERALERALEAVEPEFDWVLVDCPARADGVLTACALRAATLVALVVETSTFALQGAVRAWRLFEERASSLDRDVELRVIATLFDRRNALARELLTAMQTRFADALFDTAIGARDELREATALGVPIQTYSPASASAREFDALAAELARSAVERLSPERGNGHRRHRTLRPVREADPFPPTH